MAVADPGTYDPSLDVLEAFLSQVGRQVVFATGRALNDVALAFQAHQRTHQELTFTIRERQFFRFAVKSRLQDRANIKDLRATVWIDDSVRRTKGFGASRRPDIWNRLQFERTRKPAGGKKALAVPTDEVKRDARGLIRKKEYPTDTSGRVPKGQFIVPFPSGDAGVFRRLGRRQKAFVKGAPRSARPGDDPNVRFLYTLRKRTPLRPDFNYFENATTVFRREWGGAWERRLIDAFRTIRFRRGGFR